MLDKRVVNTLSNRHNLLCMVRLVHAYVHEYVMYIMHVSSVHSHSAQAAVL